MFTVKTLNAIDPIGLRRLPAAEFQLDDNAQDPAAIIVRSAKMLDMQPGPGLLCVARAGAGYNNIPTDRFAEAGIVVCNSPGANANAVKELVIGALILASRDVIGGIRWCQTLVGKGDEVAPLVEKGKSQFVGPELMGKTIGVVGLGGVGGLVANAAADLKMRVLGYDPYISVENAWKLSRKIVHMTDQDEMLPQCDYLSIHVPLMDATRGSFNAGVFDKMKKGAALINLARGELVNDDALIDAIDVGKVARYVTDFPNDRLVGIANVVAMPHLGASTPESEEKCAVMAAQELADYLYNGNIKNGVNLPNVYLERAGKARICVIHKNVPRMINRFLDLIGEQNINVEHMINKPRGDVAYTIIDTGSDIPAEIEQKIAAMTEVMRVRVIR